MKIYYPVFFLFFASACATYNEPKEHKIEKTYVIDKSFDKTWSGVIKYFSTKSIPIKTIDKSSGIITSDPMNVDEISTAHIFDCGGYSEQPTGGVPRKGYGSFNVFIESNGKDKTSITINSSAEVIGTVPGALYGSGYMTSATYKIKCYSKGSMEKGLAEFVSNQ